MTPLVIIRGGAAAGLLAVCCRAQRRPQQREYTPREKAVRYMYILQVQLQALCLVVVCGECITDVLQPRPSQDY